MSLTEILEFFFGMLLTALLPFLSFWITKAIEHGVAVSLSIIILPFLGVYFFRSKYKQIGVGIFIGLIPLLFLTAVFIMVSGLH
jgi:hypothetical protein